MRASSSGASTASRRRQVLIGHRGAPAYVPEHTLESYDLALEQGADAVEQDLHVTRDGALVCLHDLGLERTTDVEAVFPDRGQLVIERGHSRRRWFVHDFTLEEIKRLDAGSWFGVRFAGARVPTFDEVIEGVAGRGVLITELKDPDVYESRGVDLLSLYGAAMRKHGLDRPAPGALPPTVQSFHEPTMRRAAPMFERLDRILLIEPEDADRYGNSGALRDIARFATGIGPSKAILESRPALVGSAHEAGLRVTPWTFRASAPGRFAEVGAEMAYYLDVLDVDAVITDNPDRCPRPRSPRGPEGG
jgi:glycerophosphoryl diester phosphodiesterase